MAPTVTYKYWTALDDAGARIEPITLADHGTAARRTDASNARGMLGGVEQSFLVRGHAVNDCE